MAQEAAAAGDETVMSQREFAEVLVRKLGLFRLLPGNPGPLDCMMLLSQYGIYPSTSTKPTDSDPTPGWTLDADAAVTLDQFAVVLVRALGLQDTVEGDVQDPQNWLDALKKAEVEVTNVTDGLAGLTPLASIAAVQPIFETISDPITLRFIPDSLVQLINTITFPEYAPSAPAPIVPQRRPRPREEGPEPQPLTPT